MYTTINQKINNSYNCNSLYLYRKKRMIIVRIDNDNNKDKFLWLIY